VDAGPVALALQGGGSHGAYTWGVLDGLLADARHPIEAASGASAGAVNAVVMAQGLLDGGPEGARRHLAKLWETIARGGLANPLGTTAAAISLDVVTRFLSPYQLNPWQLNPLRTLLESLVDFPALRKHPPIKLFIAATHLRTGQPHIFREHELTVEMVLASACLPQLQHAVVVDGEHYWDGGYSANPPVVALLDQIEADDLVVVQLNPNEQENVPKTSSQIIGRMSRMMFNAPLLRELEFIEELKTHGKPTLGFASPMARKVHNLRLHRIGVDAIEPELKRNNALSTRRSFLHWLRDQGREQATQLLGPKAELHAQARSA